MRRGLLITLALALCACQEPLHKRFVPDYAGADQPADASAPAAEAADPAFAAALQHYATDGSAELLQQLSQTQPAGPAGQAAQQILSLDRRLSELQRQLERHQQLQQECQQKQQQAEQQTARLKDQLEALTESLIQQEKRLP